MRIVLDEGSQVAADVLVVLHFAFVLFVVFGGLLALRWPKVAYVHLPVAIYGALIELVGWVCPLTPLEKRLRESAEWPATKGGSSSTISCRCCTLPGSPEAFSLFWAHWLSG
jgi:uncharacterized membrane protein YhhN